MKTYAIEILVPAVKKYNDETGKHDVLREAARVYYKEGLLENPLEGVTAEDLKQAHREVIEAAGTEDHPVKFSEVVINIRPFC